MSKYMCFIGEEEILEEASDHIEAASNALEYLLQNSEMPSIPLVIKVQTMKDSSNEEYWIYSPAVLSNIGRHKESAKLISSIQKLFSDEF